MTAHLMENLQVARAEMPRHANRPGAAKPAATVTAGNGKRKWPVRITLRAGGYYEVVGRGTSMNVYLARTAGGYLVSVPELRRCGHVPANCDGEDIMRYAGIENSVDACTLAAAVRYIISQGLV